MPTALILSTNDLGKWVVEAETQPRPGGSLPYGLQCLQGNFELTWSDAQQNGIWGHRFPRAVGHRARRITPGLQGLIGGLYAVPTLRTSDFVLSIFERAGLGFGRLQGLPRGARSVPHVMLVCWLAEDCRQMSAFQLHSVRRSIRSVSRIAVFSLNQVPILEEVIGVSRERISVVPFGVDTRYYSQSNSDGPAGGGGLVAIGRDSRRDYATLLEAVRIANVPMTLVCEPRNIVGLDIPGRVRVLYGMSHNDYRALLLSADLVVTPTVAPAYPSGQSVVLEAMSMGRATLTTDSPAMREYVRDGVDGVLMPPRDPSIAAELITGLLGDANRRQVLGAAADQTVRRRFGLEHMWQGVSKVISSAAEQASR